MENVIEQYSYLKLKRKSYNFNNMLIKEEHVIRFFKHMILMILLMIYHYIKKHLFINLIVKRIP